MTGGRLGWLWVAVALAAHPAAGQGLSRVELPNHMRVIVRPCPSTEVVAVDLLLDVSVADEPPDQAGVRALVQRLLLRGTELHTGEELVRRLAEVGAYVDTGIGLDYVEVYAVGPADGFEVAVEALAEVVRHPAFAPEEVETQRESLLTSLRSGRRDAFQEVYEAFRRGLYGEHPYGRSASGEPGSVGRLTREQVAAFHARHYGPQSAVLAICGGVSEARAARAVRRAFGDWQGGPRRARAVEPPEPLSGSEVVVRELPVGRLYLVLGFPAPGAPVGEGRSDYYALQVLDSLLSGGNTARLPSEVRDRAGLAYEIASFYPTLAGASHFAVYASADAEKLAEVKEAVLETLRGTLRAPPSAEELARAKRYLAGSYVLNHQRMKEQAYALAWYELLGLGAGFEDTYVEAVEAVTAGEVQEAARRHLRRFVMAVGAPGE